MVAQDEHMRLQAFIEGFVVGAASALEHRDIPAAPPRAVAVAATDYIVNVLGYKKVDKTWND